jgi:hypothetical protein
MKVIQENESQMTLRARPWSLWILGAFFTGFGLFMVVSGSDNTLSCRRDNTAPPSCELSKKSLFSSQQQILPLENIERTTVQAYRRRNRRSYSLGLVTKTGVIDPIEARLTSEKTVEDFQQFFKDTEKQNLFIKNDGRFTGYAFAVMFIPLGLLVAFAYSLTTVCHIDKNSGQLTLLNYGLRSKSQAEYNINDIQLITLQALVSNNHKRYRLILLMESGELLPLTPNFTAGLQEQEKTATRLSNFLNLQYFPPNTN